MRTHIVNFLIFLCAVSFVSSCAILRPGNHSKQVAYFQNIDTTRMTQSSHDFVARVKPGDKLTITVQSTNIDASVNFNKQLYLNNSINAPSSSIVLSTKSAASADYYLVQPDGTINMPVIGKLNVMDKTTDEIRKIVESKVDPYFTIHDKPLVTVNFQGYKVTVIGEVKAPGDVYTDTERIGLMEAIASCGDLTVYGKRKNVMLIRENANGAKVVHTFDLTNADIFNDPYYYLQQNDVVYVEPNDIKKDNSNIGQMTSLWISSTSLTTSVAMLIVNILRK